MKLFLGFFLTALAFSSFAQWETVGNAEFSSGVVNYTTIAVDPEGTPYIAYKDLANNNKATVMKYDGINWIPVGTTGFSTSSVEEISIAISNTGVPYVVFSDGPNGNATVMKYDGATWTTVGNPQFSASSAYSPSIAIDGNGSLYVAYVDYGNRDKATVMKCSGSDWAPVGNAGFSLNSVQYISLALNSTGMPYVAFEDGAPGGAAVMKFNGSNWSTVGTPNFSAGTINYTSIKLDKNDTPYVAYDAVDNDGIATVMKYNGSNWVEIGASTSRYAYYPSIAIDNTGAVYLAFQDNSNDNHGATVMRYDGGNLVIEGKPDFSPAGAKYTSLAIDRNSIQYIAFEGNNGKATVMRYSSLTLPLILNNFICQFQNPDLVLLKWQTAQEVNTKQFNIQRSGNGIDFINIGIVKAAGNSSVITSYQYLDKTALSSGASKLFYRLQIADKDGKIINSSIQSVQLVHSPHLAISGNALNNTLQVFIKSVKEGKGILNIYDVAGKMIGTDNINWQKGFNTKVVSIFNLTPGIYYGILMTDNRNEEFKFVK